MEQLQLAALSGCNCSSKPSARVKATGQGKESSISVTPLCQWDPSHAAGVCSTAAVPRGSQLFKFVLLICTGTERPLLRAKENLCICRGSPGSCCWGFDLGWFADLGWLALVTLG